VKLVLMIAEFVKMMDKRRSWGNIYENL